jgi:hypothetical protein
MSDDFELTDYIVTPVTDLIETKDPQETLEVSVDIFGRPVTPTWTKLVEFEDFDTAAMTHTKQAAVIFPSGWVLFKSYVTSKKSKTYKGDREIWTGPYLTLTLYDKKDRVLLDRNTGQTNVDCESEYWHKKEKESTPGVYEAATTGKLTLSAYRHVRCVRCK